ncbi:hypothetical protein QFC21_000136 [Naganishia friedmannii]|uniref:Uncharacterized protein n=1 Tax=Naganishia friedmannii TaxID=89922 RepID=A0ACC2WBN0_9TREE|nr:hypothetical protein QFC21_000136 [Naganishia friedmannii]
MSSALAQAAKEKYQRASNSLSIIVMSGRKSHIRLEGDEQITEHIVDVAPPVEEEVIYTADKKAVSATGRLPILRSVSFHLGLAGSLLLLELSKDIASQIEQYTYTQAIDEAIYDVSWLAVLTSGWLLMTSLEGSLCLLFPGDNAFLNVAIVEWILSSGLAGNWIYRIATHGQTLQLLWSESQYDYSTATIYFVGYLCVCITGMLFLNAVWIFEGCSRVALQQDVGLFEVSLGNINDLDQLEVDLPAISMLQAEEGCAGQIPEKGTLPA